MAHQVVQSLLLISLPELIVSSSNLVIKATGKFREKILYLIHNSSGVLPKYSYFPLWEMVTCKVKHVDPIYSLYEV